MLIAQITDLHVTAGEPVYGLVDTPGLLKAAIAHLNRLQPQPDLVIATGDLVDQGTVEEYELLGAILAELQAPLYLAMGNHDNRDAFRQVWGDRPYVPPQGPIQYVVEADPLRLIVLDTLVEGASYGEVNPEQLEWLSAQLAAAPQQPTVICMHHPPFITGLPGMDQIRCQGTEPLASLVAQYPAVERVLCGHLHRPIQVRWGGTLGSVAPSVAHQVLLRLAPTHSKNAFTLEPPAFQLHLWHDSAGLITHTVPIGEFPAYSYSTKAPLTLAER